MASTIDWNYFISDSGKTWKPSAIRGLFPLENRPGMVSLLAGKPNAATFPFKSISIELKPVVPGDKEETLVVESEALTEGLQYGPTAGLGKLVDWLEQLQEHRHSRIRDGSWRVSVGSGSQDLINKAMNALVNPGDSVLLESPCYPGTLGLLAPLGANLVEVPVDTSGISADALEEILETWHEKRPNERFPKLLYTIPTGSNPTGCSSPLERKQKILGLARKHNLLLLEDDAYAFLHFSPDQQSASYFEIEARDGGETGRVVRFDSMSKILSSGMRIGFISGAKELLSIVDLITANTNLQPSSTTQAIVLVLLDRWGIEGFLAHTRRVAQFYRDKRDMFERVAHKHLDGLATWVSPDAGMFLYLDLNLTLDGSVGDSLELISTTAVNKGVLAVPGQGFSPNGRPSSCVRVSFSLATEQDAELAFERLAACVRDARGD